MKTEFNLSEKIRFWNKKAGKQILFYDEKDVKEFIRLLKKEVNIQFRSKVDNDWMEMTINKLAGEKLK